jgi:hypothetical protein
VRLSSPDPRANVAVVVTRISSDQPGPSRPNHAEPLDSYTSIWAVFLAHMAHLVMTTGSYQRCPNAGISGDHTKGVRECQLCYPFGTIRFVAICRSQHPGARASDRDYLRV